MKHVLLITFLFSHMAIAQEQCSSITTLLNEVQTRQFAADNNALENAQREYNEALADYELASMMYLLKENVESSYASLRQINPTEMNTAQEALQNFELHANTAIAAQNFLQDNEAQAQFQNLATAEEKNAFLSRRFTSDERAQDIIERIGEALEHAGPNVNAADVARALNIGNQNIAAFFASTNNLREAIKAIPLDANRLILALKNAPIIPADINHPILTQLRSDLENLNKKATRAVTSSLKNHLVKLKKQLNASPAATRPTEFIGKIDTAMLCFDEEKTYNVLNQCLEEALPRYNQITEDQLRATKIFAQEKFRALAQAMNNATVQNLEQIKIRLLAQYNEAGCVASIESSFNTGIATCNDTRFFGFDHDPVSDLLIDGQHILRFNNRQENPEHLAASFTTLANDCNGDEGYFCSYLRSSGSSIPIIGSGNRNSGADSSSTGEITSGQEADNTSGIETRALTNREERTRDRNIRRERRREYTEEDRRSDFFTEATGSSGSMGTGFTYGIASWLTIPTTAIGARMQTDQTIDYLNNYLYPSYTRQQDAIAYNQLLLNDMEYRMRQHPVPYADVNWFGTSTNNSGIIDFQYTLPDFQL